MCTLVALRWYLTILIFVLEQWRRWWGWLCSPGQQWAAGCQDEDHQGGGGGGESLRTGRDDCYQCLGSGFFLSGSNIFSWVRIRIGRNSGSDLEKSGSGSMKKPPKTVSTSRQVLYFIFSTLHTVLFGQVTPKPNQKNSLDGSGYGFLKSGYGSAKKPGSIRIRNTDCYECCESGMIYSGYDFLEFRIPGPITELVKNKILIYLLFHSCRILIRNNNSGSGKRFRIRPDPDSQHWFLTDTGNFYDKQQCWGSELRYFIQIRIRMQATFC